jgi:hypothetical protein
MTAPAFHATSNDVTHLQGSTGSQLTKNGQEKFQAVSFLNEIIHHPRCRANRIVYTGFTKALVTARHILG